ncbi:MAG: NAD-dependent protein deacylase [Eubacteriales bacterium]|nr:NAD-dependent protein deacylase [Clostridiales bacterium]MDD7774821.1 NAD-dependent protein deacylase [Eubacteriales bacterium]MDY3940754.1 NAD-dependent protein deacylase [Eubacteriales bacterium]
MDQAQCSLLQSYIQKARRVVFFGGAGVSTESGIPDFRSADGLYHQKYTVPPEVILSHTYFLAHPAEFYRFYRDKMNCLAAAPNPAHHTLAKWEKMGKVSAVVTQNIDGLHTKAGSRTVWELHGSIHRNYCMDCGKPYPAEAIFDSSEPVPHCACGGVIRPDVVLYEEGLSDETVEGAIDAIRDCDLLLVAGTSLTVYPAAGLLRFYGGRQLVLINRDETPMDALATLVMRDKVGEVLSAVDAMGIA